MGMIKEFKEFAMKGNVVDMAVGIVIGAAFSTVVKSLVDHVIMPPIGYLTNKVKFEELSIKLPTGDEPVEILYGQFINSLISFLIVAFALFLVIKWMNAIRNQFEEKQETASPTSKKCPYCLLEVPIKAQRCGHCTSELAT